MPAMVPAMAPAIVATVSVSLPTLTAPTIDALKSPRAPAMSANAVGTVSTVGRPAPMMSAISSRLPLKDGTIPAEKGKARAILGGMENPIVSDFMVGFIAGAQAVYPEVKIAVSYIGSFTDAAKGKEAALAQYNSGVALGFPVAAGAGLGLLAAAKDVDKYVLGVDAD